MRILVLGGCGLQGRAVLHDLSRSSQVKEVVAADITLDAVPALKRFVDAGKIRFEMLDVTDEQRVLALMRDMDVVIDVLPSRFLGRTADLAIRAGVHMVSTTYGHSLPQEVGVRAADRGVTIMPESGLDPGIDLILCGYGASQLDEVHELHSYCGGFPEKKAANNPLQYKITWTWHGVLLSYKRPAKILKDGVVVDIPAKDQHAPEWIQRIDFPGVGQLELIPNGNAIIFCEYLGIAKSIRNTSRCSMRWPGHSAFWKAMMDLNFLSDDPVPGLPGGITPHEFMVRHLGPQLAYRTDEKDLVAMRNIIVGKKDGRNTRIVYDMLDARDLETGLFAMNRTVGYTASIVAQLIAGNEIKRRGVLTAVRDIPYRRFLDEIAARGVVITESRESID